MSEPEFGNTLEGGTTITADDRPLDRPDLAAILRQAADFFGRPERHQTAYPFDHQPEEDSSIPPLTVIGVVSAVATARGISVATTRGAVAALLIWDDTPQRGLGEGTAGRPGALLSLALLQEAARFTPSTL